MPSRRSERSSWPEEIARHWVGYYSGEFRVGEVKPYGDSSPTRLDLREMATPWIDNLDEVSRAMFLIEGETIRLRLVGILKKTFPRRLPRRGTWTRREIIFSIPWTRRDCDGNEFQSNRLVSLPMHRDLIRQLDVIYGDLIDVTLVRAGKTGRPYLYDVRPVRPFWEEMTEAELDAYVAATEAKEEEYLRSDQFINEFPPRAASSASS